MKLGWHEVSANETELTCLSQGKSLEMVTPRYSGRDQNPWSCDDRKGTYLKTSSL